MPIPTIPLSCVRDDSSRPRVLVVDDHEAGRKALARYLEALGFEVTSAADGATALAALHAGPPPDFVLTDLRLPDVDGLEIAHQARKLVPPPRVALITGFEPDGNSQDHARWGIDWVFTKPLDIRELSRRLIAALPGGGPTS